MAKFRALTLPHGWIEVICGPMFAGKSDELIRKLKRLEFADVEYIIFKPQIDSRTSNKIASRTGLAKEAIEITNPYLILDNLMNTNNVYKVVAIDEAQFYDSSLVDVCDILANHGYVVMVSGLDRDFRGEPFGPIPALLTKADKIYKLTAICTECGAPATMTQKFVNGLPASYTDPLVLIADNESYAPRCRHCHKIKNKPQNETQIKFMKFTGQLKNEE